MVFTRYSAGKIRSSICIQDIVKLGLNYQINLIRLVNMTRFLYQIYLINLMKVIIYIFRTSQRHIKKQVKHLRWSFLRI